MTEDTGDDDPTWPDASPDGPDPEHPAPEPPPPGDDLEEFLTPTRRFVRAALPVIGVLVAAAMVLALGRGLIDAWLFDRAGERVEGELDETDEALARSVLLVRTAGCDGGRGSGTAFVTEVDGAPLLVTNRHVVEGAAVVGLRSLVDEPVPRVEAWRLSRLADVATLTVTDAPSLPPPLALATRPPELGDEVRTVGFPAALPFTSSGTVTRVTPPRLVTDVRTDPGASGSPLVATDGRVVGQIFARRGNGQGVATSAPAVRGALDDLTEPVTGC